MRRTACAGYLRFRTPEGFLFKIEQELMGGKETRDPGQAQFSPFVSPEAALAQAVSDYYQRPPDERDVNHTPIMRISRRKIPLLSVYPPTRLLTHPQYCSVPPKKGGGRENKAAATVNPVDNPLCVTPLSPSVPLPPPPSRGRFTRRSGAACSRGWQ